MWPWCGIAQTQLGFLLPCLSRPCSFPGLALISMQSTALTVSELNEAHGPGNPSLWFLPHGQCSEAVFDVKLKPLGEKGRKVFPCLWIHCSSLSPWASGQDPTVLGKCVLPSVKLIMALTADKHRDGSWEPAERTAAPLSLTPTTQSRPGALLSSHSAPLQISFLKIWWTLLYLTTFKILLCLIIGIQFWSLAIPGVMPYATT